MIYKEEYINFGRTPIYKNPDPKELKELLPTNGTAVSIGIVSPTEIYMWKQDEKHGHHEIQQEYEGLMFKLMLDASVNFDNSVSIEIPNDEILGSAEKVKFYNNEIKPVLRKMFAGYRDVVFSESKKYGLLKQLSEMLEKSRR